MQEWLKAERNVKNQDLTPDLDPGFDPEFIKRTEAKDDFAKGVKKRDRF